MNTRGGVRRLILEVSEWPELVCMHSVLHEVAPEARKTHSLLHIMGEIETGDTIEPPFRLAGDLAVNAYTRLEEISVSQDHIYAELAADMLHGAAAEADRIPVGAE